MLKTKFWHFSGKDEDGKYIRGIIDANNKSMAHYMLLKIGIKKINHLTITLTSYKKIYSLSHKEKLYFFQHLNMQINSGLSIFDSIQSIKFEASSFKLKYLMFIVLKHLHEGHRLSLSLEKLSNNIFSKTEISLIKASEISGSLDTTLKFICEKIENKLFIRQKIYSALIHPTITIFISVIVIFIIFKWVIPQFEMTFSQNKHSLPWITELIFSLSRHISYIYAISIVFFSMCFISIPSLIKYKVLSQNTAERYILKIPMIGTIVSLTNKIDFCYALSMLLNAGVPIHKALAEVIEHMPLAHSKHCLKLALVDLVSGKNLSTVLKKTQFFPYSAIQMIAAAENSGRLEQVFKIISQQFSNDLSIFSDHFGKMIEPFIIILLGSIIGIIVIAIYLPIFQLGSLY